MVSLPPMKVLNPGVKSTHHGPSWAIMGYFWLLTIMFGVLNYYRNAEWGSARRQRGNPSRGRVKCFSCTIITEIFSPCTIITQMLNEAPFSRACKIVFPARHVRKKIIQKDKKTRSLIRWWKPRAIAIPVLNRSRPTLQRKARRVPETNNNNNNDNKQCVYIYIYIYIYICIPPGATLGKSLAATPGALQSRLHRARFQTYLFEKDF